MYDYVYIISAFVKFFGRFLTFHFHHQSNQGRASWSAKGEASMGRTDLVFLDWRSSRYHGYYTCWREGPERGRSSKESEGWGSTRGASYLLMSILFLRPLGPTSHTRLRSRDHYTSSTLIGGKGGADLSSLLHTTLERPTEYVEWCLGAPNHTPTPLLPSHTHTIQFIEFTYCHDRFPEQSLTQKHANYDPLINAIRNKGWKTNPLITITAWVRGAIHE